MFHLAISFLSCVLFFLVKMLTPTQQATWRVQEENRTPRTIL